MMTASNLVRARCLLRLWTIAFTVVSVPGIIVSISLGQVVPAITPTTGPGNLGTTVTQSGGVYQITGGARPNNGPNLFHSFGSFNVPSSNIANFFNDSGLATSNILGRVTGGNSSNIFGTIQTTGFGNANLFLMNPAGFLFGPTATVNAGGMVSFTSADYIRLADGVRFNTLPNATADGLLSTSPVASFGFLGSNPGAIIVQGSQLSIQPGQELALVGGNITIQSRTLENGTVQAAQLSAPGGHVHLASVASAGEILAGSLGFAPNVNGQSFDSLGTIQISQKSVIDASGEGGGTVLIRGGRFVLDDSMISANTTGPATGPLVGKPGGGIDIQASQDVVIQNTAVLETNVMENVAPGIGSGGVRVEADRIEILGVPDFNTFPFTGIRSDVAQGSMGGSSGDIRLDANSILIKDLGQIISTTGGVGNAGNILLQARNNIELLNNALLESDTGIIPPPEPGTIPFVVGNAGNIEVISTHGNISVMSAALTSQSTFNTSGNAGKITASAVEGNIFLDQSVLFTANATPDTGAAGQIHITAKDLMLNGGSGISDDNAGPMKARGITVTLSNDLTLSGASTITTVSRSPVGAAAADLTITAKNVLVTQGSLLSSETFRSGEGGLLNILTENLQVTEGGQIKSGSTINPQSRTHLLPMGAGGSISIQGLTGPAGSVLIDGAGSGIFANAEGTGPGGNTNITAQSVTAQNGGTISASTAGTASSATGGSIAVSAGQFVTLNNGASITASSTGPANAGDIVINAGQNYTSTNSSVTTEAAQASGGNITVTASDMIHLTNSQINASVQGAQTTVGGNIVIDPTFVILQNSQILAQATQGQGGNISITTNSLLSDLNSIVSASSQFGVSGTVNVQSPISQAGGKIVPLSKTTLEITALLSQRCAALAGGQYSSFVVSGRDALPIEPGGWLASPLMALSDGEGAPSVRGGLSQTPMVHAQESSVVSLRRLPKSGAGMAVFSADWSEGCGS